MDDLGCAVSHVLSYLCFRFLLSFFRSLLGYLKDSSTAAHSVDIDIFYIDINVSACSKSYTSVITLFLKVVSNSGAQDNGTYIKSRHQQHVLCIQTSKLNELRLNSFFISITLLSFEKLIHLDYFTWWRVGWWRDAFLVANCLMATLLDRDKG